MRDVLQWNPHPLPSSLLLPLLHLLLGYAAASSERRGVFLVGVVICGEGWGEGQESVEIEIFHFLEDVIRWILDE